jgi:hypothetical protein
MTAKRELVSGPARLGEAPHAALLEPVDAAPPASPA